MRKSQRQIECSCQISERVECKCHTNGKERALRFYNNVCEKLLKKKKSVNGWICVCVCVCVCVCDRAGGWMNGERDRQTVRKVK
jgi:hypothetical protein